MAKTVTDLQALTKELADTKNKLAHAEQQLQEVLLVNERLVQEVELMSEKQSAEAPETMAPGVLLKHTFTHEGQKYGFAIPRVNHKGIIITPVEVCASEDLQKELISKKSGMIKKL